MGTTFRHKLKMMVLALLASQGGLYAFSLDDPAGPQFTEAQKQAQRLAGQQIVPLITEAWRSGTATVRIPPGDYRFGNGQGPNGRVLYLLEFSGLKRPAQNPLTIDATGVTFWFDPGDMPFGYKCMRFKDCSNLVFQGATLDRGTRGNIEGRITQFDFEKNRIEIQLAPGIVLPEYFNQNWDQRILPFKADGRFCAPLYTFQKIGQGLKYATPVPGSAPGRVWIPLVDRALLETIRDPQWAAAYGKLGVLEVGDGISCIYSRTCALMLLDCQNLTMRDLKVHIAKGGATEEGGDGGHLWSHCYFGPRPGTSQWQGGDGFMFNATRRGTTLEAVTVEHSTDDPINFHGYWSFVGKAAGNEVTFVASKPYGNTPAGALLKSSAAPGDRLRFYNNETGALLLRATVKALEGDVVTLDQPANGLAGAIAEWEDHQCAGWTIKDSEFRDCYQRLVIKSGPGRLLNSKLIRMGRGLSFNVPLRYIEGGVPRGILIDGNTFEDIHPMPFGASISTIFQIRIPKAELWLEDITITNNLFRMTGDTAIALSRVKGLKIVGNRIERGGAWAPMPSTKTKAAEKLPRVSSRPPLEVYLPKALGLSGSGEEQLSFLKRFNQDSILLHQCEQEEVADNQVAPRKSEKP